MKKFYLIVTLLTIVRLASFSQTLTNYGFTAGSTTFTAVAGTNPTLTGTTDEGYFNNIPVGFDFFYMGARYTTVSASTNGWLVPGAAISDAMYTNNLSGGGLRPVIAPLWDDLNITAATNVTYVTSGTAGSRIFTLQFLNNKWDYNAWGAVSSFQVKIYETTGKIEFVYRSDMMAANSPSASIGITATATGSGNFLSVNNAGTTVSSTTEASVTTKPVTGKIYSFTPPVPTAPTNLTFTGVTNTALTLNWTDNATNETGYAIYRSTDGINYTFVTKTGAGVTSSAQSALNAGNTYYWRIYAVTEGGLSTVLAGSQYLCNSSAPHALSFNGVDDYVTITNGLSASFTLEAWVNTTATSLTGATAFAGNGLFWSDVGGTANDFTFALLNNKLAFYDGNADALTLGSAIINNGAWHHIAVVRSAGSPGTVRLYVDGVQDGATGVAGALPLTANPAISIGGNVLDSRYYNGYMDEVRMWNTARTATEIANNRFTNLSISDPGLFRYLRFDEGSGSVATNNVPGQPNGTLVNLDFTTATAPTSTSGWVTAGFTYPAASYCNSVGVTNIVTYGSPMAGTFTASPAGLSLNATTGAITPSGSSAGTYTVTRTSTANGCSIVSATTVTIVAAPVATIAYGVICTGTSSIAVTRTGTAGGTYSSTAGLVINASTGAITGSSSTPGTYTVTYTIAASAGCPVYTTTTNVTVTATPAAPVVTTPVNYCQNAVASQLTATGSNLIWGSGAVSGSVGGTTALTAVVYLDNSFSNRKTIFSTTIANVTIISVDFYVPAYQAVSGLQLSIYNNGGTVIATSGAASNVSAGATAVKVTQTFNYVIAAAGSYSIGVSAGSGNVGFDNPSYPMTEITGTINITGVSASNRCFNNIQFSANNGATAPTPSTLTAGTTNYLVSQTVNGCVSPQATIAVVVNAAPAATIDYIGTPFCKSAGTQTVNRTGTTGGTYSSTAGLSIDATTGTITPATSTAGTYIVTYTIAASGVCPVYTTTKSVTVNNAPAATISYTGNPYCASTSIATVTATGTTGGSYSSTAGLVINATTGDINLTTTTPGTYTVTYTVAAAGGCAIYTTTTSVTVNASPVISQIPSANIIGNYKFEGNANDANGTNNGTLQNSPAATANRFGIANTAYSFNGTNNYVTTSNSYVNPSEFTVSIWFKTSTTVGGKLIGFGTSQTGQSGQFDRHIYMNNLGQLYFGVYPGTVVTVNSSLSYNDNAWHMATATLSPSGMVLYVDGVQVGSNAATVSAENYTGYWRIGYDNNGGWNSSPSSYYFNGLLDDALIYQRALSAAEVATVFRSPDGAGNNGPVCSGSSIGLTATAVPGATYAWTGPNSFTAAIANPSFTYSAATLGTYKLVVTALGCTTTAYTNVMMSANAGQWTGNVSTDWNDVNNWCTGVLPTSTTNVTIAASSVRMPTISAAAATNNLVIQAGATVTTAAAGTLSIAGTLTNNGTMTNSGTTIFNGTAGQQTFTNVTQFNNVTFSNTTAVLLPAAITVNGNLTITAGILNANNFNVTVIGNWTNNVSASAFTAGTATVSFSGSAAQSIGGTAVTTFNNLTVANSANTVSLLVNTNVAGNLSVNAGTFDLGTFTANRTTAGGTLSVLNNAVLRIGGTNGYPTNYNTNTLVVNSTVLYAGTNQTVSNQVYGNLTLSSSAGTVVKTLPGTALAVVGNLTSNIGTGTGVTFTAASAITVSGAVSIGAATTFNGGSYTHLIGGNWSNAGTFNGNTGTITFNGAGTTVGGAGVQNFNNLTVAASAISFSNAAISLTGNLATTGSGSFSQAAGGTVTMTGASKTISGTGISIENLTVSGSVSTAVSLNLTGNLAVSGSFSASSGSFTMSGTSKTISGAGTISFNGLSASGTITSTANFSIASTLNVTGSLTATAGNATFISTSNLSGTANLYNVIINGTSLQLGANSVLGVANVFTITSGTLNVTASIPNTVNFNGAGAQNVNAITYDKLTMSNGGNKTAVGALTVNNDLTIATGATFIPGAFTHSCYSNWINNGTFTAGTSTIKFTGTATSNIIGATTFNVLTVDNNTPSTSVVLQSNVTADSVKMITGTMFTGTNTINITTTRTGGGIIWGYIKRTHAFTTGVAYAFEGLDNTITFSTVSGVTSVTVYVAGGSIADFPFGGSISRVYDITVPAGTYNATLRLHYEDNELNGNVESTMALWRYSGGIWGSVGKTGNNTTSNYVEQSGLSDITNRWTCSSNTNVVQWNGSVSTDWNTPANWTVLQGSASRPPAPTDIVNLGTNTFNNHPTISTPVTVKNINFGSVQALALSMAGGGSLVTGDMHGAWGTNMTHTINANNQSITVNGDLDLSDGTAGHNINLNIGTGTVTINGSFTQSGGAAVVFSGAGTLSIRDNFDYGGGTFTAGTGTVTYNGTINQALGAVVYNNVIINKTAGLATISSATTINGNLTVTAGQLNNTALTTVEGNVTVASGGILQNMSELHVGGNWVNNGSFTDAGTAVIFDGAGAQSIGASTFNNLTITKPVGTVASLAGNLVINGNLTATSGTFDILTYTCNRNVPGGTATLLDNATLILAANNPPGPFGAYNITPASRIILNGIVPQALSLPGVVVGNLIFRNTGAKNLIFNLTVAGDLTIDAGSNFNAGSQTLTLKGNWNNNGTFTPATSTLLLTGTSKTINGNTSFNKVTISGSYVQAANVTYKDLLNITTTGSISSGGGIFTTMEGDLLNQGILNTSGVTTFTGTQLQTLSLINATTFALTVNFNGSVSPVLNSTSVPQYGYLNINNTGGVYPSVGWNIIYALTVGNGAFFHGGSSTHNLYGSLTNNGTITSSGTLNFIPATAKTLDMGTNFSSTGLVNFDGAGAITLAGAPATLHDVLVSNTNVSGVSPVSNWNMTNKFTVNTGSVVNAGNYTHVVGGNILINGTLNAGTSTFTLNGAGSQDISSASAFNNLTVNKTAGTANLLTNVTINNSLNFVAGNITTGARRIFIPSGGNVTGASQATGWVNGNLRKYIAGGATTSAFEIGDASKYTPVAVAFTAVTTPGNLQARTTAGDHPAISSSVINSSKSVNRYWTLTNIGVGFSNYSATVNFDPSDIDGGASTAAFGVELYNGSSWTTTGIAAPNPTSIQATGLVSFGDLAVGEICNAGTAITYSAVSFCSTDGIIHVGVTGTTGGTFSSAAGLSINAGNGDIDAGASTPGTYSVAYTIAAAGTCAIYTTTTSITIQAAPTVTISYSGSPYCANDGVVPISFSGTTGGQFSSTAGLSLNATTGAVNISASTPGNYTVTYTVAAAGSCAQYQATAGISIVTIATWTGAINNDWNTAGNWLCGAVPGATISVLIPTGLANYPVVNGTHDVNNVTIQTSAYVTVNGTLQIGGAIVNSGTFDVTTGTINLNGPTLQTIPAGGFWKNSIKNLVVNNNVAIAGTTDITGVLTFGSSNKTLTTGDFLTLKSDASGTARVAPLPVDASGFATSYVSGKIAVERYIPSRRSWRILTAPLSTTGNVFTTWQNSGVYEVGKGFLVTGPAPSVANGLDVSVQNTASMKTWNVSTQAFIHINNTKTFQLSNTTGSADNTAFFTFVRGDRNPSNTNVGVTNETTLRSAGTLQTGKQVFPAASGLNQYTIMGNPYASPVDFGNIQRTRIMKRFYAWDPHLNDVGGYVVLDDLDGDGIYSKSVPSSVQDKYIQSGQGFFVVTDTAGAANLTYYESSKGTAVTNAVFRPQGNNSTTGTFEATLNTVAADGSTNVADAVIAEFNDAFKPTVTLEDAVKFGNINETFGLLRNGTSLAIERRPVIASNDTLFFKLTKTTARNYQFLIKMNELDPALVAILEDNYSHMATILNTGGKTAVNFNVTADAASANAERFRIVFTQPTVLPVTFSEVTAKQQGSGIAVNWKVENQQEIKQYEVEKSSDGRNFTRVAIQAPNTSNAASYNWTDATPVNGDNYYRLRNVDRDGKSAYSKIVKVNITKAATSVVVYPNPVTDGIIRLQMNGLTKGKYTAQLMGENGQVLLVTTVQHPGGNSAQAITLPNYIAKGMYQLKLISPEGAEPILLKVMNQ